MLTWSSGEMRVCATQALSLSCGIRMTRPRHLAGVEVAAQPLHRNLPLVLVAVRAAEDRDARRIGAACAVPLITVIGTSE